MAERLLWTDSAASPEYDIVGPASVADVMHEVEGQTASRRDLQYSILPTGFDPLDDVLNGGLAPGHLMVIGGAYGVGKTIWGLQTARNVVHGDEQRAAVYVCYEHDRAHLLLRLLCMESAALGIDANRGLTLRKLTQIATSDAPGAGLVSKLSKMPRYAPLIRTVESYGRRLVLVKASGATSTLDQIRAWVEQVQATGVRQVLLVVDYLQKVPVERAALTPGHDQSSYVVQGLKELAMTMGIHVILLAASDRPGLKSQRMRFTDLRGSSALQYEADVGLVFNNKWAVVSREHLVYNPVQAEAMRNWIVVTMEKNRAGRNAVDIEFPLDAAHFRVEPTGRFVRERLIDERATLQ